MRIGLCLVIIFTGLISSASLSAAEIARSSPLRVSLLEVYSSEGCSSCPPAEEWVSGLSQDPKLWKDFVPVVFHVDYWNYLGWKDRFSKKEFSDRQRAYASRWRSNSIYTPGLVLNGKEWRNWSYERSVPTEQKEKAGILSVEKDGDSYKIVFEPANHGVSGPFSVHLALLGLGLVTDVKAGENNGSRLTHDFTVLVYAEEKMESADGGHFEKEITLQFPTDPGIKKRAVAVWVTKDDKLEPVQTTGGTI